MMRGLQKTDITKVADIWLDTNIKAHNFISAQYWESNYEMVKEMLLQAEVYVCESNGEIQGFIGLNGDYIEGIFVCDRLQSQGIGKLLLDFVKESRTQLSLNVYQKNTRAIHFFVGLIWHEQIPHVSLSSRAAQSECQGERCHHHCDS